MFTFIKNIYIANRNFWTKSHVFMLLIGLLFFVFALIVQHFAYTYIDNHASVTPVGDLFLNNLPAIDLDFFIVQGALITTLVILILFLFQPNYLPFSLKSLALFIIIRSFFISLTHLGINLHQITLNVNSVGFGVYDFLYNAKNDFFFSGHTGASFLFGLIFFQKPFWRNFFFVVSFIFGVSMLLAHMHYSIDVFAAPFVTYTIFIISTKIFNADYQLIS